MSLYSTMCFNFSSRKARLQMRGTHSWPHLLLVFYIFFPPPLFCLAHGLACACQCYFFLELFYLICIFNLRSSLVAALAPGFLQFCVNLILVFCVAVCCSVLQCVTVLCTSHFVLLCCSVLQCVAVCCSVLQCVAVCRSFEYISFRFFV